MRLRSYVAVAVAQASSCSSDLTPSLGTYICCGCGPKKKKKKINLKKESMFPIVENPGDVKWSAGFQKNLQGKKTAGPKERDRR